MPICQSNANLVILDQSNAHPYQICQSITNLSIQPQFYTNLPIHNQFTNSSSIWPLHAPISANRKNRTVTDRQYIGTHWHRSRQSHERMGNKFPTVHRQLTIEDQSIRTQIATQSPLNQEPIGNQSVRTLYRDLMELVLWRTHRSVSGRHHSQLTADTPIRSIANAVINHCQSNTNPMSI